MAVKLGNALAAVQAETGFNTYVCIRKLADGLEATAGTLSTIITNNVVTPGFADGIAGDPTASVILTAVDGTAHTFMRSDGAPPLSQAISPTMTGTWAFTPSADAVPVTINAPTTADMQVWDPTGTLTTVVTDAGDLGVGDATPTANVSILARAGGDAVSYAESTISALAPYAWWSATDIWGDGTNNAAGNGHAAATDLMQLNSPLGLFDKTGNGHDLVEISGSLPHVHKGCGPNGSDAVVFHAPVGADPNEGGLNLSAWLDPWAGEVFGEPGQWTVVSMAFSLLSGNFGVVAHDRFDGDSYGSHVSFGAQTNYQARYVPASEGTDTGGRYIKNKAVGTHTGMTGTLHGASNWHRFVWRYNATSHEAWIDGDLLAVGTPDESGNTAYSGRSGFTRINHNGQSEVSNCDHLLETILFDRALSDYELNTVHNYLGNKYDTSFVPVVGQPLTDWKNPDGTVDSIVDESLNFGLGTDTPTSKLHVVGVVNVEGTAVASLSAADLVGDSTFFFVDPLPAAVTAYGGGFVTTGIGTDKALAVFGPTGTDISVAGGFANRATPRMTYDIFGAPSGHSNCTIKAEEVVLNYGSDGVGIGLYFEAGPTSTMKANIKMVNNDPALFYQAPTSGGSHIFSGANTVQVVEVLGKVKATGYITGLVQGFAPPNTLDIGVLSGVGEATTDPGGDIYIVGGGGSEPGGGADGGRGANIVITPGPGGHNKDGGSVTISNGAAGSGTGVPGTITVGSFSDDGAGGISVQATVTPAAISLSAYDGAALQLSSADLGGAATLTGLTISILGKDAAAGGPVVITGGLGDTPGSVTITGGSIAVATGNGGTVSLIGGTGGIHTGEVGGSVVLQPGPGLASGTINMTRAGTTPALRWDVGSLTTSWTITVPDRGAAGTLAILSDIAYDATTWNANQDVPTKNVVRDKFETLGTLSTQSGTFSGTSSGTNTGDETAARIRALGFFDTTNDGTTSGLDADLLDGSHASAFQPIDATLTSLAALGTAADKIAYTTAADTWAEGAITAAGRALIDDADAATQRTTLGTTYALQFASSNLQNPANATTYFLGPIQRSFIANSTTAARNKTYFRRAGVIRVADIFTLATGTAGSNEAWSIYVRLNDTTDTLIATVSTTGPERNFTNTAIDITVASGDFFEIKVVDPTWATAPTLMNISGYILVE